MLIFMILFIDSNYLQMLLSHVQMLPHIGGWFGQILCFYISTHALIVSLFGQGKIWVCHKIAREKWKMMTLSKSSSVSAIT